jgi:hypothetical protein
VWHYLVFGKTLVAERSEEGVRAAVEGAVRTIEEIEREREYEPRESALCNWCDYQDLCPVRAHLHRARQLSRNEFRGDDGVTLVRRYAEAKARHDEFEAEKARLRAAVVEYARKHGLEAIAGEGQSLRLTRRSRWVLAPAFEDPAGREGLFDRLRELGLSDVLTLDAAALGAALEAGRLPPEVAGAVRELLQRSEHWHITLRKDHEEEDSASGG